MLVNGTMTVPIYSVNFKSTYRYGRAALPRRLDGRQGREENLGGESPDEPQTIRSKLSRNSAF